MPRVINRINKDNRDKTINRMERQIRGLNTALRSAEERIKKFKDFEKEQKKVWDLYRNNLFPFRFNIDSWIFGKNYRAVI